MAGVVYGVLPFEVLAHYCSFGVEDCLFTSIIYWELVSALSV